MTETEGWICEMEERTVEITAEEQNKEKRIEDSPRDLWDDIKCTNIQIIGVPEKKSKRKDLRNFLKRL